MLITSSGPRAILVDLGSPGQASLGYAAGGAADRTSFTAANRIVGNPEGAVGVEIILGGFTCQAQAPCVVALTGAVGPAALDGEQILLSTPVDMEAGQTLSVGFAVRGLRWYLAVRGGVDLVIGPGGATPLLTGQTLPIKRALPVPPTLSLTPGPRIDWFTDDARDVLVNTTWTVSPSSDRVGVRLTGGGLARVSRGELASEGIIPGAMQVPSNGEPLVFGVDHPVTGGYPVIAVVVREDLDWLAQLRPGDDVRFAWL